MSEPLVTFLGDGPRSFALTGPMIVELERLTGSGIGAVMQRVTGLEFRHADLVETIRLALIGGGASDQEAHAIVAAYVTDRPIREVHPLAAAILQHLWAGPAPAETQPDELPTFVPPVPPTSIVVTEEPIAAPITLDPFAVSDLPMDVRRALAFRDLRETGL